MRRARVVERANRSFGVGDVGGDVGGDRQVPVGKWVGEVRVVVTTASISPTHPLEVRVPALPQV